MEVRNRFKGLDLIGRVPDELGTEVRDTVQETAQYSFVWKIPWTEKPGRLQSMGSHRVGHD